MKTFSKTDIGMMRSVNQDYVFTSEKPIGNLPNLFIVADGMGGHKAGDYASRRTVEVMLQDIIKNENTEPAAIFSQAVEAANREIFQKAQENVHLSGMGTTVVLASVINHKLWIGNVGDSRLYIVNDKITQITKDHSLVQEMVRIGKLREERARRHPKRNVITRAVGAEPDIQLDIFEIEIENEDQILMCSDGLTSMLDDNEILTVIKSQRDIAEKVEKLVEKANENGGRDNITVIIIEPFPGEVSIC